MSFLSPIFPSLKSKTKENLREEENKRRKGEISSVKLQCVTQ